MSPRNGGLQIITDNQHLDETFFQINRLRRKVQCFYDFVALGIGPSLLRCAVLFVILPRKVL